MFGDLMGNFQAKQEEIRASLKEILIHEESEEGMVKLTVNGNKEIINIEINADKLEGDKEQLEDLLLITINRALKTAEAKAGEVTQSQVKEMLPPGLDKLFG